MKKYILVIMSFALFFGIQNINALTYGRVTNPTTTLRMGPGDNYEKGTVLYYNDTIPLFNRTLFRSEKGCPYGWLKVSVNGSIQYICSPQVSGSTTTVRVDTDGLNLRLGPGTNYSRYTTIPNGKLLTLFRDNKFKGIGCSGGWYQLNYVGDVRKHVCASYVTGYNTMSNGIVSNINGANIKQSANNNSKTIVTLKYGQATTIYNTSTIKGNGCSNGYYKTFYRNKEYYICSNDVLRTNTIGMINDVGEVNIREGYNSSAKIVTTFKYGDIVILNNTSKYSGAGCSLGWYKGYLNGKTIYVCSTYISLSNNVVNTKLTSDIKSSPNSSSSNVATLSKDKIVLLDSLNTYSGNGCPNGWYKIHINGGVGYVCSDNTDLGANINKASGKTVNPLSIGSNNSTNTNTNNNNGNGNSNTNTNTNTNTNNNTGSKTISSTKTNSGYMYTISNWTYRVNENYANVRSGAGTNYSWQDTLYLGTELDVLGTYSGYGCSAGWYKIKYFNNKTGYICKSLVDKYEDITKNDSAYCNKLKSEGFPESYCPYLSYLHSKHPNWVFKAEKTGVTLLNAVNGESSKNYTQISTSYMPYLKSSALAEVGGWRTASDAYVAFMLDPRSYMNEKNIFAFEDLSYDKNYHTKDAIKNMVSGSYLNNDTYAGYFLSAGQLYNVSPVHLAARVKQEGGTNANYDSVSGNVSGSCSVTAYVCKSFIKDNKIVTDDYVNLRSNPGTNSYITTTGLNGEKVTILDNKKVYSGTGCSDGWYRITLTRSLKGIYNYYNIGAYGSNPVLRGLQTAAGCIDSNDGTPWNTREKAIKYGASFIANGYINKGQNTMYYQKFNTGPNATATRYTHQYMTNILAPASESLSTYESYKSLGLLDKGYVFKIPVYNSTPNTLVTHPPVK